MDAPTLTQVGDEEWYWMAPEVLDGSRPKDLENDIWAFACTYCKVRASHFLISSPIKMTAKVLTCNPPFADVYPTETALINAFSRAGSQKKDGDFHMIPKLGQKLPKSESKLRDGWDSEQMKKCWTWDYTKRITTRKTPKRFARNTPRSCHLFPGKKQNWTSIWIMSMRSLSAWVKICTQCGCLWHLNAASSRPQRTERMDDGLPHTCSLTRSLHPRCVLLAMGEVKWNRESERIL